MQLLRASTYHRRKAGPTNGFRYTVDYVLTEPEQEHPMPWLMSRNRRNLTALWDNDHGGERGNGTGAAWVREVLAARGLDQLAACCCWPSPASWDLYSTLSAFG